MSDRMKLLPALITLLAGGVTSVITFLLHYDTKKSLVILLVVLILFFILGTVLQKVVFKFEVENELEAARLAEEEGKVVEKDAVEGENTAADGQNGQEPEFEGSVTDTGSAGYMDQGYTPEPDIPQDEV